MQIVNTRANNDCGIALGKISRFAPLKPIDWAAFARRIVARLEELGKKYYIKEDLKKYLNG